jgi:hypothetical protein
MADQTLTPQQIQDALSDVITPDQMDIVKNQRAQAQALRGMGGQGGAKEPMSFAAGFAPGLAGGMGNLASVLGQNQSNDKLQQLLDAYKSRGGSPGGQAPATPSQPSPAAMPENQDLQQSPQMMAPDARPGFQMPTSDEFQALNPQFQQPGMATGAQGAGQDPLSMLLGKLKPGGMGQGINPDEAAAAGALPFAM